MFVWEPATTLKAKMKEQESSIKDLKFQNSVLLDRIAAIEKYEKQKIYSEIFPKSNSTEPGPESDTRSSKSLNAFNGCHCCRCHVSCQIEPSTGLSDVHLKLDAILHAIQSSVQPPRQEPPVLNTKDNPHAARPNIPSKDSDTDSVVSIDHFMPDPDIPEQPLNSIELTSRSPSPTL